LYNFIEIKINKSYLINNFSAVNQEKAASNTLKMQATMQLIITTAAVEERASEALGQAILLNSRTTSSI